MSFVEKEMDYFMFMQLQDMASSFLEKDVQVQFNQVSFLDIYTPKVTISSFWENRGSKSHLGEKSDIYLRALGNYRFSDRNSIIRFEKKNKKSLLPSFSKQLFAFLEDIRLEQMILSLRPGTIHSFHFRKEQFIPFFQDQWKVNLTRGFSADSLFCELCLNLLTNQPHIDESISNIPNEIMIRVREMLFHVFMAKETEEVEQIAWDISLLISSTIKRDMVNMYFTLPKIGDVSLDDTDEDEIVDETLPAWTRNRKKHTKESFMQFDNVNGEHQKLNFKDTPRESEGTDQVFGFVQGKSQQTELNDHSEASMNQTKETGSQAKNNMNRYAKAIFKHADVPSEEDLQKYEQYKEKIYFEKKKLVKLFKELLLRKREYEKKQLHYGKLDKKLIPFFTEESPKLFYKIDENKEFDCVFSLLIDCSSSMLNKMEQTKEAIVLFHETLKSLRIPHSITGFWEDGMESDEFYQPNYFFDVIPFNESLNKQIGPNIMQLKPEEDNRDGFAIRIIGNRLAKQKGAKKFLLLLTDGKPAAFHYFQNGILDTKEAIQEMRKIGVQTIGIQMENKGAHQDKIMEAMYNNQYIINDSLENISNQFSFVLKKLLMKTL
jgi:nitric oxide reductase activation protein